MIRFLFFPVSVFLFGVFPVSTALAETGALGVSTVGKKPLAGIPVTATQGGKVKGTAFTGKNGRALLPLEAGRYQVNTCGGGKRLQHTVTVPPGNIGYLGANLLTGRTDSMPMLCRVPRVSSPITVGPKIKVGGGAGQVAEKVVKDVVGGVLGGFLGGGGGSPFGGGGSPSGESAKPETADDPVKNKQKFTDPATGTTILVGGMPTGKGILISTRLENAPGNGTFQTAFLEDPYGRVMQPVRYEVYALYLEWTLQVSWTRDTYVDGQLVKHEEGGWTESGTQLLDLFTKIIWGKPIWKRLGFNRAVDGVKGLGTVFAITTRQLRQRGPLAFVVHVTRPNEDPVTTVPFVLTVAAASDGKISFKKADKTPAEKMCDEEAPQLATEVAHIAWGGLADIASPPAGLSGKAPDKGKDLKGKSAPDSVVDLLDDIDKRRQAFAQARRKGREAADAAYKRAIKAGASKARAAKLAGIAAGRAAAKAGASPKDAGTIAGNETRDRGGSPRDAVNVAADAVTKVGGDYRDIAQAAGQVAKSDLDKMSQEAQKLEKEIDYTNKNVPGEKVDRYYEVRFKEFRRLTKGIISRVMEAGQGAGATPSQIGQAIGMAFQPTAQNHDVDLYLGSLIRNYLKDTAGGGGLVPLEQGILTGNAILASCGDKKRAGWNARTAVYSAGGSDTDQDGAARAFLFGDPLEAFFGLESKPESKPAAKPGPVKP
ncbi:hypothetical protein ACFLQ0_06755 [Nitrospinota bacterium]